jgi:hypothetical protein
MIEDALIGIEWEPQLTVLEYPQKSIYAIKKSQLDIDRIEFAKGDSDLMIVHYKLPSGYKEGYLTYLAIDDDYYPSYYYKGYNYFDVDPGSNNIELRTHPVKLEMLKDHIEFCTNYLSHVTEDISSYSKGIGVFLPVSNIGCMHSNPSKHVSISFPAKLGYLGKFNEFDYSLWKWLNPDLDRIGHSTLKNFKTHVAVKKSSHVGVDFPRFHIRVPYNFTAYHMLVRIAYKLWTERSEGWFREHITALFSYLDNWTSQNIQQKPLLICHGKYKKVKIANQLI